MLGTYGFGHMQLVEDEEGGDMCINTFRVEVSDVTGQG